MSTTTMVPRVTVYGDFISRSLDIADALDFAEDHAVTLILGRMREGYLGREMVTLDDLRRWVGEAEMAAQWADVEAGAEYDREVSA